MGVRAPAQGRRLLVGLAIDLDVRVGEVEQEGDFRRRQPLGAEQMAVGKTGFQERFGPGAH